MSKVNEIRMQIIEVFEKYRIMDNPEDLTFEEMCHDDLTAILTELMEPITDGEIEAKAKEHGFKTSPGDSPDEGWERICSIASFRQGAEWAAARNLKIRLEGLKRYNMGMSFYNHPGPYTDESSYGDYVKFEDVEKLVGGTQ